MSHFITNNWIAVYLMRRYRDQADQDQYKHQQQLDQVNNSNNNKKKQSSIMWSSSLVFSGCLLLILASFAINEISANSENTLKQQLQSPPSISIVSESMINNVATIDDITTAPGVEQLSQPLVNTDNKQETIISRTDRPDLKLSSNTNAPSMEATGQTQPKKKKHNNASSKTTTGSGRNGRQYDSGQSSYGQQLDLGGYANQQFGTGINNNGAYPTSGYNSLESHQAGYPSIHSSSAYSGSNYPYYGSSLSASSPSWSSSFPLLSSGFGISEIACVAVAVVIGAIVLGGPFILLYLFMMNQMNGGMGQQGQQGAVSLTGPSSATTVNGRKKRQASLSEALFNQLSPLINNEQLLMTFKSLINSMAKYSAHQQ